jgi:hypothetical protein
MAAQPPNPQVTAIFRGKRRVGGRKAWPPSSHNSVEEAEYPPGPTFKNALGQLTTPGLQLFALLPAQIPPIAPENR